MTFLVGAFLGAFAATVILVGSLWKRPREEPVTGWRELEEVDSV